MLKCEFLLWLLGRPINAWELKLAYIFCHCEIVKIALNSTKISKICWKTNIFAYPFYLNLIILNILLCLFLRMYNK